MTYLSHSLRRQTLKILLNKKIAGFTPLKPKHHWNLMLKMVFRRNSLHFESLIMFMDGLYLDNDFRTRFLRFYYFWCYCYCLLVFLLLFLVLLFHFIIIIIFILILITLLLILIIIIYSLNFFLILCGYVRYYFVKLLDSPIIYVHDVCIPFYVIFNTTILVLRSLYLCLRY